MCMLACTLPVILGEGCIIFYISFIFTYVCCPVALISLTCIEVYVVMEGAFVYRIEGFLPVKCNKVYVVPNKCSVYNRAERGGTLK